MPAVRIFILLGFIYGHAFSQNSVEVSFSNGINVFRNAYGAKNSGKDGLDRGQALDYTRNRLSLTFVRQHNNNTYYGFGIGYVNNAYEHRSGFSGRIGPNTYIHINEHYSGFNLNGEIGKNYLLTNSTFRICFQLFPTIICKREIYSLVKGRYLVINSNEINLSHIDSRIAISWLFGPPTVDHFVLSFFVQPPSVYLTNMLPDKVIAVNIGFGIGGFFGVGHDAK